MSVESYRRAAARQRRVGARRSRANRILCFFDAPAVDSKASLVAFPTASSEQLDASLLCTDEQLAQDGVERAGDCFSASQVNKACRKCLRLQASRR
jgi:hypothetical protein